MGTEQPLRISAVRTDGLKQILPKSAHLSQDSFASSTTCVVNCFANKRISYHVRSLRTTALAVPPEQLARESLSGKSHFYSLRDRLIFMFQPELRKECEIYINQQATLAGLIG